ncbi:hypothetical protein ANCCAN_21119 [Ancylostoma caninum]|uniref:Uncharacterized protein n=1 Tax=Ancylostoma caninum TaxID=29170 RepID=A0A368FLE7_ANCCA|nr:hypothetical protein ANCCAN_21119 [Ancylostoma caninum]
MKHHNRTSRFSLPSSKILRFVGLLVLSFLVHLGHLIRYFLLFCVNVISQGNFFVALIS